MSELEIPESWAGPKWSEIVDIQGGGQPPKSEFIEKPNKGYVRLLQIRDFESDDKAVYIPEARAPKTCKEDDILIGRYGASVGRVCTGKAGAYNVALVKCLFDRTILAPLYFKNFLKSQAFQRFIVSFERAAQGGFNKEDLAAFQVPLPPLGEQKRIVAKIEACFSKIDEIEKSVDSAEALLKKYRESLLAKAFRGELVLQDPKDEPASKMLERIRAERDGDTQGKKRKKDELPPIDPDEVPFEIPKSWTLVRTSEACLEIQGGSTPEAKKLLNAGSVQFLKVYNLSFDGTLNNKVNPAFVSEHVNEADLRRSITLANDVLINIVGPPLGKVSIIPSDGRRYNHNQAIVHLRPSNCLDSIFLCHFFQTIYFRNWTAHNSKRTSGQANISVTSCREIIFPLPPLNEQKRIVAKIESCFAEIDSIAGRLSQLRDTLKGQREAILKNAFSGSLVPQDPSEGTGHDLLRAITQKTEPASSAAAQTKKPRKRAKV